MLKKDNDENIFENAAKILYGDKRKKEQEEKQERNSLLNELRDDLTPAQILYSSNKDLQEIKQRKINSQNQFNNKTSLAPRNVIDPEFQESFAPKTKEGITGFAAPASNKELNLDNSPQPSINTTNSTNPIKKTKSLLDKVFARKNNNEKPKTNEIKTINEIQQNPLETPSPFETSTFQIKNNTPTETPQLKGSISITDNEVLSDWERDDNFMEELVHLLDAEGEFTDRPNDKRTNHGITQDEYNWYNKKHGIPSKDVKDITMEEVAKIYYEDYWKPSGANQIDDEHIRRIQFDSAVNHGVGNAKKFHKEAGDDFDKYFEIRKNFYNNLVKKRPEKKEYYEGWMNRINKLKNEKYQED